MNPLEILPKVACIAALLFGSLAPRPGRAEETGASGPRGGSYLVLSTGYAPGAARMLARAHGADVVSFSAGDLSALAKVLRSRKPDYAALVMDPEEIDVSFQKKFLCAASSLDEDPYLDLSFGYITGRSPEAAETFVRNILGAPKAQVLTRAASVEGAPTGFYVRESKGLFGQDVNLVLARNPVAQMRQKEVLEGKPLILLNAHGGPYGGGGGLGADHLKGVSLSGAVLFNGACYNGVVSSGGKYDREKLFALAVLDTGVSAYYAGLGSTNSALRAQAAYHAAVEGMALGDACRVVYDRLVTNLQGLRIEALLAMEREGVHDPVFSRYIDGTHAVLFGDPAARPFLKREGALLDCGVENAPEGCKVSVRMKGCPDPEGGYLSFWQYYPNWLDWRTRAVHCSVDLPEGFEGVSGVEVRTKGGRDLLSPVFGVDRREGKCVLHVLLPVPLGTLQNIIRFTGEDHEFALSVRKGKTPLPPKSLLGPAADALRCVEMELTGGTRGFSMMEGSLSAEQKRACARVLSTCSAWARKGGRLTDLFLCYRGTANYLLGNKEMATPDFRRCFANPTLLEINILQGKPLAWAQVLGAVSSRGK